MKNRLPEGWKEFELGEICELKRGSSITKDKVIEGTVPVIAGGQKPAYYHNISNRTGETITVSGSGAYAGFIAYFDKPLFASDCSTIQPKNKGIFGRYIYYFLKSKQEEIYKLQQGIAQPHVYPKDLAIIKIPLPPPSTQRKIVQILEKNEQAKKKREDADKLTQEYLKSVFYEMFGDPRRNNKKFATKKGSDIFELAYGEGLTESNRDGGKYPVYGSNGKVGSHSTYLIKGPGIIVGRKGSIGELNFANENFWPIDTTYYIKLKGKTDLIFLFYLLRLFNLSSLNKSAAIPGLNRNDVYSIDFIEPSFQLQQKFAKIVEKVEKLKEKQQKSKEKIDEMFDSLMQKAFKGELVR